MVDLRRVGKNRQKLCVGGQVFEKALKRPVTTRWQILPRWKAQEAHEHMAWPVYQHIINLTDYRSCITIAELRKTCIYE